MLRTMTEADLPAVAAIEQAVNPAPWTLGILSDCLRLHYEAHVLELDSQIIGFSFVLCHSEECHIMNIAIAQDKQRHGYGKQLLRAIVERGRQAQAKTIYLEVRATNEPAIALYKAFGFACDGVRKGYYREGDGAVDALLFSCSIF